MRPLFLALILTLTGASFLTGCADGTGNNETDGFALEGREPFAEDEVLHVSSPDLGFIATTFSPRSSASSGSRATSSSSNRGR